MLLISWQGLSISVLQVIGGPCAELLQQCLGSLDSTYINRLEKVQGFAIELMIRAHLYKSSVSASGSCHEVPSSLPPASSTTSQSTCLIQTPSHSAERQWGPTTANNLFREHRAYVEWHPRGHSGSGNRSGLQKVTQTASPLTLFFF